MIAMTDARRADVLTLLGDAPQSDHFAAAYHDAVTWLTAPPLSAADRERLGRAVAYLEALEHEMDELHGATAVRWDGRSSAFLQADLVAAEDRQRWLEAIGRLAAIVDDLRRARDTTT